MCSKVFLVVSIVLGYSHCNVFTPLFYKYQPLTRLRLSTSSAVTPNPLLAKSIYTNRGLWDCNELEQKINDERRLKGFSPLKCDPHMRWTADQHIQNAEEAGYNGFNQLDKSCNLHSWFGDYECCYKRDHSNPSCMWNKPYELSKWDKRNGFEISAAHSAGMTPERAFSQWKGSPGHYAVFVPTGSGWRDIKTVGCTWRNTLAHCWFSKKLPATYDG